jgi:hypothetical protein
MPVEGMVHALHRAHALLAPGGCLIDLHPTPADACVEVGGVSIGPLTADEARRRHAAAESALAMVVHDGLFAIEGVREFPFHTYGESIGALREHVHATWRDSRIGDGLVSRVGEAVRAHPGAAIRVTEQVRITKYRPLR